MRFYRNSSVFGITLLFFIISAAGSVGAGPIILGQSCAMSGPSRNIGLETRAGLLAAFSKYNHEGGFHGRPIRLLSLDDGYEPDRAVKNARHLIDNKRVFLLIGGAGTPTARAVMPIAKHHHIPFFAPLTGAEFLRNLPVRQVVNLRASYNQEMEELAAYLIGQQKFSRIACFYQNDFFGIGGLEGLEKALRRRGVKLTAKGSYERNTVAVMGAVQDIFKAEPEAVVMIGDYSACAEFIKLGKNKYGGKNGSLFCCLSSVGAENLRDALGSYGENVIVSQVVPLPGDLSVPLVREYVQAMKKYQRHAPISFTTLEGYMTGKLFVEILARVEGELTREKFIQTILKTGSFDLGGVIVQYGENDNQGLDEVFLTVIYPEIKKLPAAGQP